MRYVRKPGRLANANERGAGVIVHAVDSTDSVFDGFDPALCGSKPGGRMGWTDYEYMKVAAPAVNCPKCLAKLTALQEPAPERSRAPTTEPAPPEGTAK